MNQNQNKILEEILSIIQYPDDKEAFIKDFTELCLKQALLDVVSSLPREKQEELSQKMIWGNDQERQKAILAEYITPDVYTQALQHAAKSMYQSLYQELLQDMSDKQKKKLQEYLGFSQQQSSTLHANKIV